jgi:ElaB/YqjD/DUF883 family membrane-anchored ribosome-binding protein
MSTDNILPNRNISEHDGPADTVHGLMDAARTHLGNARDSVESAAGRAADMTERYGHKAGDKLTRASDVLASFVRERPFVAIGAAFALGYFAVRMIRR